MHGHLSQYLGMGHGWLWVLLHKLLVKTALGL